MYKLKTRCQWCPKQYSTAGRYLNHLQNVHPDKQHFFEAEAETETPEQSPPAKKRRLSDVQTDGFESSSPSGDLNLDTLPDVFIPLFDIESEPESEGSDREFRDFSDAESDEHSRSTSNLAIQSQAGTPLREHLFRERDLTYNLHTPFKNLVDYKLARWFNAAKVSEGKVNDFLKKDGILKALNPTHKVGFRSAYTMYKIVDAGANEPSWFSGFVDYPLEKGVRFRYRNIISCIKYLLRQKAYAQDMVWGPTKEYDKQGDRVYSEMHTATWWEDNQASIPDTGTLIPILLASDETHLTNFSGDKKLWPVYMSIGNIRSTIRNTPTMHAWIPIALLPIAPKRVNKIPGYSVATQEIQALQTVHDVLARILRPLSDAECRTGYEMVCGDEKVRLCFPKLFCWLADHMENATIHGIASNRCPACICPVDKLGEYRQNGYPARSHKDYAIAVRDSDTVRPTEDGVKRIQNALWTIPDLSPPDLIRADILHNILLGVLDHVMDWIQGFLEYHERITAFDHVWRRLPAYPGFTVPKKAYRAISQWSGKEMRDFGKIILGTFTAALRRTSDQPRPTGNQIQEFNKAIRCVRSITDFYLMTQYRSHTDKTVSYMQEYLRIFHETKDVFLRFRAQKAAKKAAAEAHKELVKEQASQVKGKGKALTASAKDKLRQENMFERQELVDEILKEGAHYNFPKIHLISHYAEQISKFGALTQYSTEISETMHKGLKDAYRRSNRIDATSQILKTYTRDHTFAMQDLTMAAWNRIRQDGGPTDGVGTHGNGVYLKLRGKIEFGTVSNFRDLEVVAGLSDLIVLVRAFLMREMKGLISEVQQLLDHDIIAYRSLEIPVPRLDGEGFISHPVRCTGLKGFRGRGSRNDWIWVRRQPASDKARPGTLNGRIPGRLNALFKLKAKDGTVNRLAHVTLLQSDSTAVQGVEGMIQVKLPQEEENKVFKISQIEGMAHLIPLEPEKSWLINNRIDLETWNTIYD